MTRLIARFLPKYMPGQFVCSKDHSGSANPLEVKMKLRIGNACWHAFHVQHAALALEAGFFAQEGIDAEIVHAKINPKAISSSRPGGERYDEVGNVVRDMVAYGIDIIPDVHVRTPFAERVLGNDEVRIIGGWRSQFRGTLVAAPGIKSIAELKNKRIGDWYKGGVATMWYEQQFRNAGIDPDREIDWKIGYKYGSLREAWKPLLAGETDAAIVQNPFVPQLLERGFNKLYDFVEDNKPHGRPGSSDGGAEVFYRAQSRADQTLLESFDPRLSIYAHQRKLSVFPFCRSETSSQQSRRGRTYPRSVSNDADGRSFFSA